MKKLLIKCHEEEIKVTQSAIDKKFPNYKKEFIFGKSTEEIKEIITNINQ